MVPMDLNFGSLIHTTGGKIGKWTYYKAKHGHKLIASRPTSEHKALLNPGDDERCSCWAWRYADYLYQGFDAATRKTWNDGLKKSHMTGYDLWMKEAMHLIAQGLNPPDTPSVSGGWSTGQTVAGVLYPLPAGNPCEFEPPPEPEPPVSAYDCENCHTGTTPAFVLVTISGLTGPPSVYNGSRVIAQDWETYVCTYTSYLFPLDIFLRRVALDTWLLTAEGADPIGNLEFAGYGLPADCMTTVQLELEAGFPDWMPQPGAIATISASEAP